MPTVFCSLVKPYALLRGNMRSANKLLLTEHTHKNSLGARSLTVSAAKAWNTLPNNIIASYLMIIILFNLLFCGCGRGYKKVALLALIVLYY